MSKNNQKQAVSPVQELGLTLDDLVKRGARQVIQQAIEAELAELLSTCSNITTLHGKRAVVRNGYLPEREVLTAAGQIVVIFIDNTPLTLKKGITTQAEVTEVLGDPDTVSAGPTGGVVWTYIMDATVLISEDRTSFVITPSQTSKGTLILVFDASKKFIEFKTPPSGAI